MRGSTVKIKLHLLFKKKFMAPVEIYKKSIFMYISNKQTVGREIWKSFLTHWKLQYRDRSSKGERTQSIACQNRGQPTGMHNVHRQGIVDRCGRPTSMHHVYVADGRSKEGVGQPTRSTDRRICFSCWDSDLVSETESNPIVIF